MRVGVLQAAPNADTATNLERLGAGLAEATRQGVDVLVTPEMFLTGYNIGAVAARSGAQPVDGPLIERVRAAAVAAGVAVVVGFPEQHGDAVFNTAVFIDAQGNVVSRYRKTHLFGSLDHAMFQPGGALSDVVEFNGIQVALAICYDIEFPEVARSLAGRGAEAILVPTANWLETVNTRLVPARAQENGVWIVYANFAGTEGDLEYCGASCVVDPEGGDAARGGAEPTLLTADVTAEAVRRTRAGINYLNDRRDDLYGN